MVTFFTSKLIFQVNDLMHLNDYTALLQARVLILPQNFHFTFYLCSKDVR